MHLKALNKSKTNSEKPADKRLQSLNYIKRNMLRLIHTCTSSEKSKPLPHVLMAYSVGRRSVIANSF